MRFVLGGAEVPVLTGFFAAVVFFAAGLGAAAGFLAAAFLAGAFFAGAEPVTFLRAAVAIRHFDSRFPASGLANLADRIPADGLAMTPDIAKAHAKPVHAPCRCCVSRQT